MGEEFAGKCVTFELDIEVEFERIWIEIWICRNFYQIRTIMRTYPFRSRGVEFFFAGSLKSYLKQLERL